MILEQSRPAGKGRAIVFSCDRRLIDLVAFVIHRLREVEPDPEYEFCLCTFEPRPDLPEQIVPDIRVCRLDPAAFAGFPVTDNLPLSAYLCLVLPGVFAEDYDRIVALDCDILPIGAKMSELLHTDMRGRAVAAVLDQCMWRLEPSRTIQRYREGLGIADRPYFNAGVILYDVARCVETGFYPGVMEYAREHAAKFRYADQSALNGYLKGDILPLSLRWNWQTTEIAFDLIPRFDPYLLHFIGPTKPYLPDCRSRTKAYREIYEDFFNSVLQKDIPFAASGRNAPAPERARTEKSLAALASRLARRAAWPHRYKMIRRLYESRFMSCKLTEIERAIGNGSAVWPRRARRAGLLETK